MADKWFDQMDYDAVLEADMAVCVESYIGDLGGYEGVKLEEMVRIAESGCELVGRVSCGEELLA